MSGLYDALLALTDRVERLVGQGHWVEASAAEAERQRLLERYVGQAADVGGLRKLLERNRGMLEVAQAQRAAVLREAAGLTQRKRALDAYAARHRDELAGDSRS